MTKPVVDVPPRVKADLKAADLKRRVVKAPRKNTPVGAVAKTEMLLVGGTAVLTVVSGDHALKTEHIPKILSLPGEVSAPSDGQVGALTGYAPDEIPPIGLKARLPVVIDANLKRFDDFYAPAGSAGAYVRLTMAELKRLTRGILSFNLADAADDGTVGYRLGRESRPS